MHECKPSSAAPAADRVMTALAKSRSRFLVDDAVFGVDGNEGRAERATGDQDKDGLGQLLGGGEGIVSGAGAELRADHRQPNETEQAAGDESSEHDNRFFDDFPIVQRVALAHQGASRLAAYADDPLGRVGRVDTDRRHSPSVAPTSHGFCGDGLPLGRGGDTAIIYQFSLWKTRSAPQLTRKM